MAAEAKNNKAIPPPPTDTELQEAAATSKDAHTGAGGLEEPSTVCTAASRVCVGCYYYYRIG